MSYFDKIFQEAAPKLSAEDRRELPKSAFGLPDERKYLLISADHVKSAIHLFGKCPQNKRKQLAKRILRAAKKYGVEVDKNTEVYKAVHESSILSNDLLDILQEADTKKKETKKQDQPANDGPDEDQPTDYTDDGVTGGDDTDEPTDYTAEEEPDYANTPDTQQATGVGTASISTGGDDTPDTGSTDTGDNAGTINVTGGNAQYTEPSDTPTDYTASQEPTDDTNSNTDTGGTDTTPNADTPTDYTSSEEPTDTTSPDTNNNIDVKSDDSTIGNTGTDVGSTGDAPDADTPTDYTSSQEPGEGGDDGTDGDTGTGDTGTDTTSTDTGDDAGTDTGGGDSDLENQINELQATAFSNLTDAQLKLKINNVKDSYIKLYTSIVDTAEKIVNVNRSSSNIKAINFVSTTLNDLKDMVRDALTDSFNTKSLVENQLILQKFIAIYAMVLKIVERIAEKAKKEEDKED